MRMGTHNQRKNERDSRQTHKCPKERAKLGTSERREKKGFEEAVEFP